MWSLVCLFALLVPRGPQESADASAETIAEFKRFYGKANASAAEKIEAIHVLDKANQPAAIEALLDCFDDPDFSVRQAAVDVVGSYASPDCADFLIEKVVKNKRESSADKKALAVEVLARMKSELAIQPIIELLEDAKGSLQIACIAALGKLHAKAATPMLLKGMTQSDPVVRIAVLDAFAEIADPTANAAALAQLKDPAWQVRVAAVGALGRIRQKESVQPLIDQLRAESGRLRDDVKKALISITTSDLGDNADKWQEYWDKWKDRFKVPSDEEVRKAREAFEATQARYNPGADDFAGVPTKSKRIVYVIDISGSMEDPILNKEKFKLQGRTYSDYIKLEIVKYELVRTIKGLDDTVFFNIITFASKVKPWKTGLVQANILNRNNAADWVSKLKPIGGSSQNLKKKAGLANAAGGGLGKTNTYEALMTALDSKALQAGYDTNLGSQVDTIFFLSDGDPTEGPITEPERILDEVKRVNLVRKITINTINIGNNERGKMLMKALSSQNGGTFLDLGE